MIPEAGDPERNTGSPADLSLYTVIDIGSNTVKYSSYRCLPCKAPEKTGCDSETLRLLQYLDGGDLREEGVARLCAVLTEFKSAAASAGVPAAHLLCFATAGFRRLRDPAGAIGEIRRRTGVAVRLLSGEEEAALSFRGMLLTVSPRPVSGLMLDMGGGSTERILFDRGEPLSSVSHPFGALSLYGDFVGGEFPTAAEAEAIRAYVRKIFAPSLPSAAPASPDGEIRAYIVGGTAKAIAALNPDTVMPGRIFTAGSFRALLKTYLSGRNLDGMRTDYPDRYRVIVPGMLAYDEIFSLAGVTVIQVADGGLRDGVLQEFLGG